MRLRRKPWIKEAVKQYEDILVPPEGTPDWAAIFGRKAPLHVEVGTGRGRFITGTAAAMPEADFVGIEAQLDIIYTAAGKVRDAGLGNVRLMNMDAALMPEFFGSGAIDRLYINFCDPWPKNRHAKRRLTHRRFLAVYRELLVPGGVLCFKTDNRALFEFSLEEFTEAGLELRAVTFDLHKDGGQGIVTTEYEERFRALGMKICRCEVVFGAGREN